MQSTPTDPGGGAGNDTGYVENSPRLDYEVNFAKSGIHYIWIRGYGQDGNSDSCHAGINGEDVQSAYRFWSFTTSYTWLNVTDSDPPRRYVEVPSAGVHTINVWMREDACIVDKIVLTTNPDYTPTDEGPAESHRGPRLKAYNPSPEDGAQYLDIWVNLSWSAADTAVSHDVYFGENFDDVNEGTEDTFRGNQAGTFYIVGFPGYPYPEGLVPGTTYYWRVDEVEADGTTKHKGDVWSFWIHPRTAFNSNPPDGAAFVNPEGSLSWEPGFGAKLHYIFFGDNFDDVNDGVVGMPLGETSYDAGPFELEKTYFWRVDEFDGATTYKGNTWSFTTAGEGVGVRGDYYTGMNFGNHALSRTDPEINFNWGDPGGPDPSVGDDQFSARWTGEVGAPFTETYTFYTNSDDGVRLWIDGQLLIDNWTNHANTEDKGTIDLVAGNTYSLVMEYYEDGGGAVAQLRWSSPHTEKQIIPTYVLTLPIKAGNPSPSNGAVDVKQTTILTWAAGEEAASHQVYFGTDADSVANADTSSPEYKGSKQLDSESHDPGKLDWNVTYYWRVDEIEGDGTLQKGNVWSFTTANFIIVDDMESYNDLDPSEPASNRIFLAWIDGFDNPAINGSIVGYANPPFAEQTIVHSGRQSMPFEYNNSVGKSEATLTLTDNRDWTENSVDRLVIWYIGDATNDPETMYVVLNGTAAVTNDNPNAAQDVVWTEWSIDLQEFNIDLTNVNTITLGFGNRTNPVAGGSGMMYFDDIRLYAPAP
jgi:hypothetical protein